MKSLKFVLSFIVLAAVAAAPLVRAEDMAAPAAPAASTAPAVPAASDAAKLTPEQQAKVTALLQEQHKALKAVKKDTTLKPAEKKAKVKAIQADYKAQIDAVTGGK